MERKSSSEASEDFFEIVGSFGSWQKIFLVVHLYVSCVGAWPFFAMTFLAPKMDFWCVEPYNFSLQKNQSHLLPFNKDEQCYVPASMINSSAALVYQKNFTNYSVKCTEWEYDASHSSSTFVNEWNLVCDQEWLISLANSIYMIGFLISAIFFGQLSDSIGRFPSLVISFIVAAVSATLSIFCTSYMTFVILRFFQAFGRTGLSIVGYVLMLEIVGSHHRAAVGIIGQLGFGLGMCILPVLGYLFPHWYWFQVAIAVPLMPVAFTYKLVPESPRWLMMQGKYKELEKMLTDVTAQNNRTLKCSINKLKFFTQSNFTENERESKVVFDLFRTPKMRCRTLVLMYIWIVNAFLFWALSFNTNDLEGNPYLNFFISGFIEFPSAGVMFLGINHIGRRPSLVFLMIFGGMACGAVFLVPEGLSWLSTTFIMIWRFCLCGSFGLLYFYTSELYPTVVRNVAIGFCATFARIGSILAPFVKELSAATHPSVSIGLYVFLSVTSGLLALILPETKGRTLPNTLEEGEFFGDVASYSKLPSRDVEMEDHS